MSQFKIEFTLKQHTPIIHFQSEQKGATLRATELKPKFDKFLLEKVEDLPFKKNANGSKSLDYKVKIEFDATQAIQINARESLFFGNMGDAEEKKYKHNKTTFKITFLSFNPTLQNMIKKEFEAFLANTNFGTRQSKGYGSFYLVDDKNKNISFKSDLVTHKVYSFSSKNWEKDVKVLYSFLRQGINLPNREGTRFYSKPAIFSYAKSKGWTWDKKAIKKEFFHEALEQQKSKHTQADTLEYSSKQEYLLRDLFGLSSEQSWLSYRATIKKESKEKDKYQRFKSPLHFKIIAEKVYFWVDDSYKEILGKTFIIKGKGKFELSFPNEFNFEEFLDFAFNINLSKHIDSKYQNQPEYAILNRIFKDIKDSKK